MKTIITAKKVVIFCFLALLAGYLLNANIHRKTLLILHSYDDEYAWVRDVNRGIDRILKKDKNFRIFKHYMDTKNHPEAVYKAEAGIIAQRVVDYINPDVILAVDDDAQEYVAKHYLNRDNLQIVFVAVNAKPEQYGFDKATNVTGVLERVPYEEVKMALTHLATQRKLTPPYRALHISDQSIIVKYDDINMHEYKQWAPVKLLPSELVATFDEWKKAILDSPSKADFILISNYRKVYASDKREKFVPYREVVEWTFKHSPLPVIGVNGFVCEDGAALSIATSPIAQGQLGAEMALDILHDRIKACDIPIQVSPYPMIFIHEERFKKRGYKLPQLYEAFARATNNFYSSNNAWLIKEK